MRNRFVMQGGSSVIIKCSICKKEFLGSDRDVEKRMRLHNKYFHPDQVNVPVFTHEVDVIGNTTQRIHRQIVNL